MSKSYIGPTLKAARQRAGFSQAEIATALHVKPAAVSQWETGDTWPSVHHLITLCIFLRVDINRLHKLAPAAIGAAA